MQKFLLLLLSLVLLGPLGIDLYLPTIPAIAIGLGSSEAVIQSTISLFILVLGLGQIIAGPLVDKYGRKPIALVGIIIYMIGAAMAALSTTPTLFVASRLLQGVAVCCTAVVAFSGVRDRMNGNEAARAFGFLNGTLNIVPALAPLLGGLLAEAFGWRAPFWFLVAYGAAVLVLIAFYLPETRPADTKPVTGLPLKQYWRILNDDRFLIFPGVRGQRFLDHAGEFFCQPHHSQSRSANLPCYWQCSDVAGSGQPDARRQFSAC